MSYARTAFEFFAGIGLIHEAIKPFGWEVTAANDNSAKKVAAYKLNYPGTSVLDDDVNTLDVSGVGPVRLATASFPCIDLSQAGGRQGINGDKSSVVWAFLDRVADFQRAGYTPEFLFLENVPGLLSLHEGRSVDLLLHRIAELGYCFDLVQVDARHFTPQTRNRVFIIAVHGQNRFTRPSHVPDVSIRRYKVRETYQRNKDLPWVFFDFPALPHARYKLVDIVEKLLPEDRRWWSEEQMDYFWSHLERHHRPQLCQMVAPGVQRFLTSTRRGRRRGVREQIINVRFDGAASCLRTPKGGSSAQFVIHLDGEAVRVRKLLGVEAARLQGVCLPDASPDFKLHTTETEVLYGFGDAVCVPAVRWVFQHSIEAVLSGHEPQHARLPILHEAKNLILNFGS